MMLAWETLGVNQGPPEAARGTRIGLSVKAPVARIGVLRAAFGAHREAGHRRVRPIAWRTLSPGS